MPISLPFAGEKDPIKKVQSAYSAISESDIDAIFVNENKKKDITRDYVEMIIEDFALLTQNQALYNKFLQIDTKLEKSLREYQAEVKGLLNSIVGLSAPMQNTGVEQMNQPVTMPQMPQAQPMVATPTEATPQPKVETPQNIGVE